jgi:hypothetical protein
LQFATILPIEIFIGRRAPALSRATPALSGDRWSFCDTDQSVILIFANVQMLATTGSDRANKPIFAPSHVSAPDEVHNLAHRRTTWAPVQRNEILLLMSVQGQNLNLPHRTIDSRLTSISGHTERCANLAVDKHCDLLVARHIIRSGSL